MAKTVLITNKAYGDMSGVGIDYCHDSGVAYTNDRYFSIVNETFDFNLKLKSRFLYWIVKFFYETTDYKKEKQLSNHKYSRGAILGKLFFIGCIIGLICAIIWGVAIPIVNSANLTLSLIQGKATGPIIANYQLVGYVITGQLAANLGSAETGPGQPFHNMIIGTGSQATVVFLTTEMKEFILTKIVNGNPTLEHLSYYDIVLQQDQVGQAQLIPKIWTAYFNQANAIIPILLTLFFVGVIWVYRYRKKKLLNKLNSMSVQDYLSARVLFVKNFKFILKRWVPMVKGVKELNHRFVFAVDALGTSQLYYNFRLLNYLYSIFPNMNVVMVINIPDDGTIEMIQKIIAQDFNQNLNVLVVEDDQLQQFKSVDGFGYLFNKNYLSELKQDAVNLNVSQHQNNELENIIQIKTRYEIEWDHELRKEIDFINYQISKTIYKSRNKLSDDKKRAIIEDVVATYQRKIAILSTNFLKSINSIEDQEKA